MTGPPPPAETEALYAALLDRFDFDQIARMTDRQIHDLVGHQRNEDGTVRQKAEHAPGPPVPGPKATKEQEWADLFVVGRTLGIPESQLWDTWLSKYPEDAHLRPTDGNPG